MPNNKELPPNSDSEKEEEAKVLSYPPKPREGASVEELVEHRLALAEWSDWENIREIYRLYCQAHADNPRKVRLLHEKVKKRPGDSGPSFYQTLSKWWGRLTREEREAILAAQEDKTE